MMKKKYRFFYPFTGEAPLNFDIKLMFATSTIFLLNLKKFAKYFLNCRHTAADKQKNFFSETP